MKDPHVHVEKTLLGMGRSEMGEAFAQVLGDGRDPFKTVGTGCGKRRKTGDVSRDPAKVTCRPCREWTANEEIELAEMSEAAMSFGEAGLARLAESGEPTLSMTDLQKNAAGHRAMAEIWLSA